jgi:hypothetical protein
MISAPVSGSSRREVIIAVSLVGIADAVAAAIAVFGEGLGEVEVRGAGIEYRNPALVAVRHVQVVKARFQRLRQRLPCQSKPRSKVTPESTLKIGTLRVSAFRA